MVKILRTQEQVDSYKIKRASKDFDKTLNQWLARAQHIIQVNHDSMKLTIPVDKLSIDPKGRKFIRIVRSDSSVYCFIDKSNGDVLKAATWRAPAKHARGNIYEIGNEGVTAYGAHYLT